MKKLSIFLVLALLLVSVTAAMAEEPVVVPLNTAHEGDTNPGFEVGECPTPPVGQEGWWGWHFIMPNNNFTSLSVTFETAGTFSADPFPGGVFVADPDNSHAYIWTPTPDKLLAGSATSDGDNKFFNLSHVCPGAKEELKVTKTAETSYTREHFWDIAKKVETEKGYTKDGYPKIWLYTDGMGDEKATWTVDVTYMGYEDKDFKVSGVVTIENTGTLDAIIKEIVDVIGTPPDDLTDVVLDCGVEFPYTLPVGDTLICTYSVDGYFEGANQVKVITERANYPFGVKIVWGDPTKEINKTVTVKDISDLFGEVELGTVTAPDNDKFTYSKYFAWKNYGKDACGSYLYKNTATIVETKQSASAALKVNVQCFVYETAYAKGGSAVCFIPTFKNWGWTNPITKGEYVWPLWAGAAQCNTSKGTNVGSVSVQFNSNGYVTVNYNVAAPYILAEKHVYAGYEMFPKDRRGNFTVAPGLYTNASPFNGSQVWVIAHAVVGIPDPNFGPVD